MASAAAILVIEVEIQNGQALAAHIRFVFAAAIRWGLVPADTSMGQGEDKSQLTDWTH